MHVVRKEIPKMGTYNKYGDAEWQFVISEQE